ncbi:PGN_0703 family putative restriction endonuclease [Vulgatibacter sp.]|uniref:PGN_0703 family putative restriction endonuclease n=1 Tax=Vulgatibacter sp. TaxID=1971226 RepID=UPI003562C7F8
MQLRWNDPRLLVASDDARRARYRALQSWWRETVLGLEPGLDGEIPRANLLPEGNRALNFLDPRIAAYAASRAQEVLGGGGTLDPNRLERNLLSSMPLCFNVFGLLRAEPETAARVLATLFDLPIHTIEAIEVEWAPAEHPLLDRTAFDAFVAYRTEDGRRGFVGVETKYTEPFSQTEYESDAYESWTATPVSGFRPGAAAHLVRRATNQLWRNALLAVAVRADERFDLGHVAVLGTADDTGAATAVAGLRQWHERPDELLRAATLEALVRLAKEEPPLASWASAFERRYLDLAPIGR